MREIAGDRARLREIVGDCGVYNMVFFDGGAWRMLPGDAHTCRDRPAPAKWSKTVVGGVLVWPEIPNIRLVLLARSRPPFSTISSARDDPYSCEHLREAFSTLRYRKIHGCCTANQFLYLSRSLDPP